MKVFVDRTALTVFGIGNRGRRTYQIERAARGLPACSIVGPFTVRWVRIDRMPRPMRAGWARLCGLDRQAHREIPTQGAISPLPGLPALKKAALLPAACNPSSATERK